jgi:hypothetical protein
VTTGQAPAADPAPVVEPGLPGMRQLSRASERQAWTKIHFMLVQAPEGLMRDDVMDQLCRLTGFSVGDLKALLRTLVQADCLYTRWVGKVLLEVGLGPAFKPEDAARAAVAKAPARSQPTVPSPPSPLACSASPAVAATPAVADSSPPASPEEPEAPPVPAAPAAPAAPALEPEALVVRADVEPPAPPSMAAQPPVERPAVTPSPPPPRSDAPEAPVQEPAAVLRLARTAPKPPDRPVEPPSEPQSEATVPEVVTIPRDQLDAYRQLVWAVGRLRAEEERNAAHGEQIAALQAELAELKRQLPAASQSTTERGASSAAG